MRGLNRHDTKPFQGLQFLCNSNPVSNEHDVYVIEGTDIFNHPTLDGVRDHQGSKSPNFAAANTFSGLPIQVEGHIKNVTQQAINYHYETIPQEPVNITSGLVVPNQLTGNTNSCGAKYLTIPNPTGNPLPVVLPLNANLITDYYAERKVYNDLLYNYYQQLDNGNTDSLINAINLMIPSQAQQMRDNLIAQSPYVSTQALSDAANTGVMTDALLLEVCLANPDATQSEGFLDFVEFDIPNTLPSNMVQLIYQSWGTETARTLLELELAGINAELGHMSKQILQHYLTDTLDHKDSIESILESRNSIVAQYRLVEYHIEQEDFTAANAMMTTISNEHSLSTAETNEHNNLQSYINFRSNLVGAGKSYLELDQAELTSLRAIADANTGRSAALARNILCFGYQECTSTAPATRLKQRRARRVYDMRPAVGVSLVDDERVSISPNPASEEIFLEIKGMNSQQQVQFQLIELGGKILVNQRISSSKTRIDVAAYPKGSYLYKVILNKKEVEYGKILIR